MKIKLNNGIEAEITSKTRVYHNVWQQSGKIMALKYSFHTRNFRTALTHSLYHNWEYYIDIYTYRERFIEFHRTWDECREKLEYIITLIEACK